MHSHPLHGVYRNVFESTKIDQLAKGGKAIDLLTSILRSILRKYALATSVLVTTIVSTARAGVVITGAHFLTNGISYVQGFTPPDGFFPLQAESAKTFKDALDAGFEAGWQLLPKECDLYPVSWAFENLHEIDGTSSGPILLGRSYTRYFCQYGFNVTTSLYASFPIHRFCLTDGELFQSEQGEWHCRYITAEQKPNCGHLWNALDLV